jgi:hypothetical protein
MPLVTEAARQMPRRLRLGGTVVLGAVLLFVLVPVVRYTLQLDKPPMFQNFGVIETSIGSAVVACGGEVTGACGETTALVFGSCDTIRANFPESFSDPKKTDQEVRDLIGKRPPSGSQWSVACGFNGLRSNHQANLNST